MANVKRDMSSQVWLCVMNSFQVQRFLMGREEEEEERRSETCTRMWLRVEVQIPLQEVICTEEDRVKISGSSQTEGS